MNVFPSQIEEILLGQNWCSGHFQIHLSREGRLDQMAVHVECQGGAWDGDGMVREAEEIIRLIKNTIGITTRVVVEQPGALERSIGKIRRVIDKRG